MNPTVGGPTLNTTPELPIVITITPERINALITLIATYNGGNARRSMELQNYPGGSYVYDSIIIVNNGKTEQVTTQLAVIAPGSLLVTLSEAGLIVPALDFTKISASQIYPGINDFNVVPTPTPVVPIPPTTVRLVGGVIAGGDGTRHYAISSPFDHFADGGITLQDSQYYRKSMVQNPFGFSVEWDAITVVGPTS